jgi:hypothetical protein
VSLESIPLVIHICKKIFDFYLFHPHPSLSLSLSVVWRWAAYVYPVLSCHRAICLCSLYHHPSCTRQPRPPLYWAAAICPSAELLVPFVCTSAATPAPGLHSLLCWVVSSALVPSHRLAHHPSHTGPPPSQLTRGGRKQWDREGLRSMSSLRFHLCGCLVRRMVRGMGSTGGNYGGLWHIGGHEILNPRRQESKRRSIGGWAVAGGVAEVGEVVIWGWRSRGRWFGVAATTVIAVDRHRPSQVEAGDIATWMGVIVMSTARAWPPCLPA